MADMSQEEQALKKVKQKALQEARMRAERASSPFKLKVTQGDEVRYHDLPAASVTIGRSSENDLVLRDGRLSRHHCRIEYVEGEWFVVDVGSQNGTWLNGRRVRRSPLSEGDEVRVGGTRLTLMPKGAAPEDDTRSGDTAVMGDLIASTDGLTNGIESEVLLRLQAIAAAMNSELHVETLLNQIIDHAIEMTGAERAFLILVGKSSMEFRVARNFERQEVGSPEFAVSWSIATRVSSSGEPLLCVNAAEDERFSSEDSVLTLGLRSVMCVPFKVRNRVLGVVYVDNRLQKGVFSEMDFRILKILADHAATALENARLYEEVLAQKQSLEEMNCRLNRQVEEQDSRLRVAHREASPRVTGEILDRPGTPGALVGDSAPMRDLRSLIRKVAKSDLPVLITGESGTGKELVAKAVHAMSSRARRSLVSENCCAIPETLLESELFGYKKGAFTGASSDRDGLFVAADKGSLFLDEIGDLPMSLQIKLLRVLQEGDVRPIGAEEPRRVDVRLMTATNQDLEQAIEEGRFREDLYYRIKVVSIAVPPLRDRREDIPLLIEHFLLLFAREQGAPPKRITPEAVEILKSHAWPGNVRELQNELKSMAALGGDVLGREDVPVHVQDQVELLVGEESGFHDLNELVEAIESREIQKAMRKSRGNKTRAAELLGISRFALQRKMDKYGLRFAPED